ncbi:MAG TPA: hypothetical protein VLN58_02480 [Verrucomicrobiae bacterium]|nr:hypothetical protein [Verrucomicrobiae bacterium]
MNIPISNRPISLILPPNKPWLIEESAWAERVAARATAGNGKNFKIPRIPVPLYSIDEFEPRSPKSQSSRGIESAEEFPTRVLDVDTSSVTTESTKAIEIAPKGSLARLLRRISLKI